LFPVLIDFGPHTLPLVGEVHPFLPTYGVLFALAVLVAWWWYLRRARTLGLPEEALFNQVFYALLAGIAGAKLLLVLVDWRYYLAHPAAVLGTLRSAGVLIGGVVAGALSFAWYARRHGLPLFALGDAIAAPLALAQSIGRLGCFCAGCCYGVPAAAGNPLAVTFSDPRSMVRSHLGVPLVPVQLIQMVHDLLLALFLAWLWRHRPHAAGTVFWSYVVLYGIGRGVIEHWRGDVERGLWLGGAVSTSQLLSAVAVFFGGVMLVRGLRGAR